MVLGMFVMHDMLLFVISNIIGKVVAFLSVPLAQESFVCEVEVLRREMQSTEFHIEAEFLTTNEMIEKGLSE